MYTNIFVVNIIPSQYFRPQNDPAPAEIGRTVLELFMMHLSGAFQVKPTQLAVPWQSF
jgi:hypothetical protein